MKAANNSGFNVKSRITAFTLIELLVVISVISILMTILLPSLARAKESGRRVSCLSNMRQLTIAWMAYATENNEFVCSPETQWNGLQPWDNQNSPTNNNWVSDGLGVPLNDFCNTETAIERGVLWPYLETVDVYSCNTERIKSVRSYAISETMGFDTNCQTGYTCFLSTDKIVMPAQKMVFIDFDPPERLPNGWMNNVGGNASSRPINIKMETWRAPYNLYDDILKGGVWEHTARHNNGSNLSFADGHVEYWRWKDNRTILLMNEMIGQDPDEADEASIDNEDIARLLPVIRGIRDREF